MTTEHNTVTFTIRHFVDATYTTTVPDTVGAHDLHNEVDLPEVIANAVGMSGKRYTLMLDLGPAAESVDTDTLLHNSQLLPDSVNWHEDGSDDE